MTAPDVAALAAALRDWWWTYKPCIGAETPDGEDAEAIIAALAASGWRITSAPTEMMSVEPATAEGGYSHDEPGHSVKWPSGTWHGVLPPSADDPVSAPRRASAAPDYPDVMEYIHEDRTLVATNRLSATEYGASNVEARDVSPRLGLWVEATWRDEQAVVRAALEGLRAEVDALPGMAIASSTDSQRLEAWVNRPAILALIDARLAALDE